MHPRDMIIFDYEHVGDVQRVQLKENRLDNTLVCYLRLLIQTDLMFRDEAPSINEDNNQLDQ